MSTILVLLSLPVIIVFTWFALEFATVAHHAGKAKSAADAIALAAAARFPDGPDVARADAIGAAGANHGPNGPLVLLVDEAPGGGGDLEFGTWDAASHNFTHNPTDGGPAVRATVRLSAGHPNGTLRLLLAHLFGLPAVELERSSIAVYHPPTHTTSLLLSDAGGSSLALSGSSVLRSRGGVSVASASADAVQLGSVSYLDVPILRAAGELDGSMAERVSGSLKGGASIPADPFAGVSIPVIDVNAETEIALGGDGAVHVAPGVHASLAVDSGVIVLDHGLHQFDGPISLTGTAVLELSDATVELTSGAALEISGAAVVRGTCESGAGNWDGYAIIQQAGTAQWSVGGSALLSVTGRCYSPGANLQVSGTATARMPTAVLRSVALSDDGMLRFSTDIREIAEPVVPGRARLVK
jgi:hypothetical protein